MEITKLIRSNNHNLDDFRLYPEYFNIIRNAIRCGTISRRRYKFIKVLIDKYSFSRKRTFVYNIHPSLFQTIKKHDPCDIFANIFPAKIVNKRVSEFLYYIGYDDLLFPLCIRYIKHYINALFDHDVTGTACYDILKYCYDENYKRLYSVILIMDNILEKLRIEVILSYSRTTGIGCSYFDSKISYFIKLEYYIRILVRRRRCCIVIRYGDKFFDLLVRYFSPFISKNCSRLAMYYV